MLLRRELVEPDDDSGFRFLLRRERAFRFCWHHHEECELTWIARGSGTRFVGEDVRPFESGDLVLLGPDLPHTWWSPDAGDTSGEAYCVQFSVASVTAFLEGHPQARGLQDLIDRSGLGLQFPERTARDVGRCLLRMERSGGLGRLGILLECLDLLARAEDTETLCSERRTAVPEASLRIDAACQYVLERFEGRIRQPDVAAAVGMQPAPFARFFRRHTGHTLTSYIQHSRIGRACGLLRDTSDSVLEIALASGFENLSNFNRVFKRLRGCTPREYRKLCAQAVTDSPSPRGS